MRCRERHLCDEIAPCALLRRLTPLLAAHKIPEVDLERLLRLGQDSERRVGTAFFQGLPALVVDPSAVDGVFLETRSSDQARCELHKRELVRPHRSQRTSKPRCKGAAR